MNSIKSKVSGYMSPQSILLKVEQEGFLCTSVNDGLNELDGNHEGFGSGISFSWDHQN